jgi:hypothetical protein
MHLVASRYARLKQRQVPTTGHLFERRYRAKLVDADGYLLALVRYIHYNPVRAALVRDPGAYPWSSHGAYVGRAPPDWLVTGPLQPERIASEVSGAGAWATFRNRSTGT